MNVLVRCFTKSLVAKANSIAIKRGYNRALIDGFVDGLSDERKYPVYHHMVHKHKGGEPCEPHIRVVLATNDEGGMFILDCDWNMFQKLPFVDVSHMFSSNQ